jgi:hypothetical protein
MIKKNQYKLYICIYNMFDNESLNSSFKESR